MSVDLAASLSPAPPGTAPLYVEVAAHGDAVTVEVRGELDLGTVTRVTGVVEGLAQRSGVRLLTLDLSGVTFFGAAGIRALMRARDLVGGRLVLRDPAPVVRRIMAMTGDLELFTIVSGAKPVDSDGPTGQGGRHAPGGDLERRHRG